jgi:transposase
MAQHLSVLGIDIAKHVFHVVGMDHTGTVVLKKRLGRGEVLPFLAPLPPLLIGMEACGSAHYWARQCRALGHKVKLMAPQFVNPYVKSPKNDSRDAEAICEAVTRPTMRFVPIKQVEQQDVQARHRVRERLMKARTALVNELRGLCYEYGIVLPPGVTKFHAVFQSTLEAEQDKLTALSAELFRSLYDELLALERRLAAYNEQLEILAQTHPVSQRVQTIPGIGPLSATALVAAVSDATQFKNGRQFAAWLGLVPREHSTGGKARLLGISKRGDVYLRKLLVHGARTTLRWVGCKQDRRSRWARTLLERRGKNRAAVALANKNARLAWVLMTTDQVYQSER